MNRDDISVNSEDSSSYNSEFFKEEYYDSNNIIEKFKIYKSIIKELKLSIISNSEETLSIEKSIRKQSFFNKYNVIEYKFLVIGDHNSGKTSFCLKFAKNKFNLETKPSKEIECYLKTFVLFGKDIKIYLIDYNEELIDKNMSNNFYSDIKGVFAIYDVTKYNSLEKTVKLIEKLKEKIGKLIPFILVGNKTDLNNLKVISINDAKNKTQKLTCECRESNCLDENGVKNIVKYFVSNIYYNDLDDIEKNKIQNDILIKENKRIKKNQNL